MDCELFQEKMDPNHRMYFCRMLKMKELPECLLEHYARVKKLADRTDGFLSVGDLALLAVMAEADYQAEKEFEEKIATPVEAPAMTGAEAEAAHATAKPVEPLDEADDQVVEDKLEQPVEQPVNEGQVSGSTGQAQKQQGGYERSEDSSGVKDFDLAEAKGEKPVASDKVWSPGMPVNVLDEDELKQGKIVGVIPPAEGSDKAVQLTIEYEGGEIVTVNEDEVEAI